MGSFFQYTVNRDITLRYFTPTFVVVAIFWIVFITIVNVVVVGYESVFMMSTNFSSTPGSWYSDVAPKAFQFYSTRSCNATSIKINEGSFRYSLFALVNIRHGIVFAIIGGIQSPLVYRWEEQHSS
jgi:hypothetical protein